MKEEVVDHVAGDIYDGLDAKAYNQNLYPYAPDLKNSASPLQQQRRLLLYPNLLVMPLPQYPGGCSWLLLSTVHCRFNALQNASKISSTSDAPAMETAILVAALGACSYPAVSSTSPLRGRVRIQHVTQTCHKAEVLCMLLGPTDCIRVRPHRETPSRRNGVPNTVTSSLQA